MAKNTPATKNKHTPQNILNWSFDEDFSILSVGLLGYDLENGTVVRSSHNDDGTQNIRIRDQYGFEVEATPMDELRTIIPSRLVGANFNNATLDAVYWTGAATGSGANTVANAQLSQVTGTTADSTVSVQSVRVARYIGGSANRFRTVVRQATAPLANNIRRWGAYDANNGAFFELNGTTLNVVTRKGTTDTAVASASWNGKAFTMDTNAHVYEIYWTNTKVYFVIDGALVHTLSALTATWTASMNLPARASNNNTNGLTTSVTQEVRTMTIYRLGAFETQPTHYFQSGTTEGVVLKSGAGNLHGMVISGVAQNSAITLYDNTAASGTVIWASGTMGAQTQPFDLEFHTIPFANGLTLVVAAAASNVLVVFE